MLVSSGVELIRRFAAFARGGAKHTSSATAFINTFYVLTSIVIAILRASVALISPIIILMDLVIVLMLERQVQSALHSAFAITDGVYVIMAVALAMGFVVSVTVIASYTATVVHPFK